MDMHLKRHQMAQDKLKDLNKTLQNTHFNITVLDVDNLEVFLVIKYVTNLFNSGTLSFSGSCISFNFENYIQLCLPVFINLHF